MNKVKIVCTLGPKTSSLQYIKKFKNEGMDIVRLNGSHGSIDWIKKTILDIRRSFPTIPVLVDLPGSKIRIVQLNVKKNLVLGEIVIFTCDEKYKGSKKLTLNNNLIYKKVKVNSKVLADDGNLVFKIIKKSKKDIYCKVLSNGILKTGKGVSFNIIDTRKELISKEEIKLIKILKNNMPDFIGVSYTKNKDHIKKIKKLLNQDKIKIIAKIENNYGIKNLKGILKVADGIMIDRGDLSLSPGILNITIAQKDIIKLAQKYGKPTIIATEFLSSMIKKTLPTKPEISDITNAVYDGCAATMLSEETVSERHPHLIVRTMKKIIDTTLMHQLKKQNLNRKNFDISNAASKAAVEICRNLPISKIIVITKTGFAARLLSLHNLKQNVYAVTNCEYTARSFNLIRGTEGIYLNINFFQKSTDHIIGTLKKLYKIKKINNNDLILIVAVGYPKKGNKMNLLQIHQVKDLVETFKWRKS